MRKNAASGHRRRRIKPRTCPRHSQMVRRGPGVRRGRAESKPAKRWGNSVSPDVAASRPTCDGFGGKFALRRLRLPAPPEGVPGVPAPPVGVPGVALPAPPEGVPGVPAPPVGVPGFRSFVRSRAARSFARALARARSGRGGGVGGVALRRSRLPAKGAASRLTCKGVWGGEFDGARRRLRSPAPPEGEPGAPAPPEGEPGVRSPAPPEGEPGVSPAPPMGEPGVPARPEGGPGRDRSFVRSRVARTCAFGRSCVARADARPFAVFTSDGVRKGGNHVALRRSRTLDCPAPHRPSAPSLDRPAPLASRPSAPLLDRPAPLAGRPSAPRLVRSFARSRVARSRPRALAVAGRTPLTPAASRRRRSAPSLGPPSS